MIGDELPIARKNTHEIGQDLSPLSIAELDERMISLHGEIERLAEARKKKLATQAAADALFKRSE